MTEPIAQVEVQADFQGRSVFGLLAGDGQPTVILDAGLGDTFATWAAVQPQVAAFSRVLSYDRAGLGRSGWATTPRTSQEIVQDLRGLLHAARLKPPYLYVAHSWSSFQARWFANQYPTEIAGMVLIDGVHEDKYALFEKALPPERAERMWLAVRDPEKNDERIDRLASIEQTRATQRIYTFPLTVITRAANGDPLSDIEIRLQSDFLALSVRSRQQFSRFTDHFIHQAEPELVVNAIRQMVAEINQPQG